MDTNTYVLAAVLNSLRRKELDFLPPEVEFTAFNLSDLGQALNRPEQPSQARENLAARVGHVEAIA